MCKMSEIPLYFQLHLFLERLLSFFCHLEQNQLNFREKTTDFVIFEILILFNFQFTMSQNSGVLCLQASSYRPAVQSCHISRCVLWNAVSYFSPQVKLAWAFFILDKFTVRLPVLFCLRIKHDNIGDSSWVVKLKTNLDGQVRVLHELLAWYMFSSTKHTGIYDF